ncbi:MAG: hypothetical protein PHZ19_10985 [Candidatus Thermoplasmatota archaeon]|nr:hypothetical protein [Candidatus Thermoplasmatota archaeon]
MRDLFDDIITDDLLDRLDLFFERWTRRLAIIAVIAAVLYIIIPGIYLIITGG